MTTTLRLPADTLVVIDRTTAGNINPDRRPSTDAETVAQAIARQAFDTSRGTLQVRATLADAQATAAALGVPQIDSIWSDGAAVYAVVPSGDEIAHRAYMQDWQERELARAVARDDESDDARSTRHYPSLEGE